MKNQYGSLASWIYHVDKPIGRSFGDIDFYLSRLRSCEGPILEPAVGNGRFLVPLLEAGHVVYGFDASRHMLEICKRELESRQLTACISHQSFEDFVYRDAFSAAVIPAGSIQLITSADACFTFLKRLKASLSPGGKLIVDLDSLTGLFEAGGGARMWHLGDDMLTLTESRISANYLNQVTTSLLRYEHWRSGRLVSSEIELFALRFWGVNEFASLLREAGFRDISITLDYKVPHEADDQDQSAAVITFEAVA